MEIVIDGYKLKYDVCELHGMPGNIGNVEIAVVYNFYDPDGKLLVGKSMYSAPDHVDEIRENTLRDECKKNSKPGNLRINYYPESNMPKNLVRKYNKFMTQNGWERGF